MEQPKIIYESKNFIVVDKPAGLLVHPTAVSRELTLVDWVLKKYPEIKSVGDNPEIRPGIVHRLDKDTSGVILIARNQNYFEYLKKLFQTRLMKKTYLVLAYGKLEPKTGTIEKPIAIKSGTIKRTVWMKKSKDAKEAITEYEVLKYFKAARDLPHFSFLRAVPKTGRTHQIRIHLASIGHPIVGDSLYGKKENHFGLKRQFLHAESLEFNTAEGRRIKIEAELPEELKNIISKL
ncbi:MAG: RluA family pseudouridine synthase [Patescibacteria group bacterium]